MTRYIAWGPTTSVEPFIGLVTSPPWAASIAEQPGYTLVLEADAKSAVQMREALEKAREALVRCDGDHVASDYWKRMRSEAVVCIDAALAPSEQEEAKTTGCRICGETIDHDGTEADAATCFACWEDVGAMAAAFPEDDLRAPSEQEESDV